MAPLAPEMPIISRFTFCYPLRVCRRLCRIIASGATIDAQLRGEKARRPLGTAGPRRVNGLTLVVHLEVFDFVLQLDRFGIIVTQGVKIVEVLLVDIPGHIYAVEHRAFKLLNIRVLRAHRVDQIVEIWKIRPSAPMIWRISSTSRPWAISSLAVGISIPYTFGKRISGAAEARYTFSPLLHAPSQ